MLSPMCLFQFLLTPMKSMIDAQITPLVADGLKDIVIVEDGDEREIESSDLINILENGNSTLANWRVYTGEGGERKICAEVIENG